MSTGLLLVSQRSAGGSPPPTVDFPTGFSINCGGAQFVSPVDGEIFEAERNVTVTSGGVHTSGATFAGTENDPVVQTQRHGVFQYDFSVPNGNYLVTLGLGENYAPFTQAGSREHTYVIEGVTVLDNYDTYDDVGQFTLVEKTFAVTVADSVLTIAAVDNGVDRPSLGYIRVRANSGAAPAAISDLALVAGDTTVTLSFTKPVTATGVRVFRATASPVTAGSTDLGLQVNGFVDTGLTNTTEYFYAVRAENANGNSALSNEESATPVGVGAGITLYVTTTGSDAAAGTIGAPLLTLTGARNQLRTLTNRTTDGVSTPTPAGGWLGATVIFGAGTYYWSTAVAFDERDGGTVTYPIVYRAAEGETVKWTGAYQVPDNAWVLASTVPGADYNRLPDATDDLTYRLDVNAAIGEANNGDLSLGDPNDTCRLISGSTMMRMSRYPNGTGSDPKVWDLPAIGSAAGWLQYTSPVSGAGATGTITVADSVPNGYLDSDPNGLIYGTLKDAYEIYWARPGAFSGSTVIPLTLSYDYNLAAGGQLSRFVALRNYLEALDTPGEYVWAHATGLMYLLAPAGGAPTGTALTVAPTLVTLGVEDTAAQACNYVQFRNLILEGTRFCALRSYFSTGLQIVGCEFRNGGGEGGAIIAEDATTLTISSCTCHDYAQINAVWVHGGSVPTLTEAGITISDTAFSNIGFDANNVSVTSTVMCRRYDVTPETHDVEILRDACGVTIADCTFTALRGSAIGGPCAHLTVEDCVFDRVCAIVGDAGVCQGTGFRYGASQYNVYRRNTFRDIRRVGDTGGIDLQHQSSGALYCIYSDVAAGVTIEDNTVINCDHFVIQGAGLDCTIERNLLTDVSSGHYHGPITFAGRTGSSGTEPKLAIEAELAYLPLTSEPWLSAFPDLINYRVGGTKNSLIVRAQNVIVRDNLQTNGPLMGQVRNGMEPATVGGVFTGVGGFAGTLSTRTSDVAGTITLGAGHTVTTGNTVTVGWKTATPTYPVRPSVTVGTVSGTSVPFSGGSGTVLPLQGTAVIVWLHTAPYLNYPVGSTGPIVEGGGTVPIGIGVSSGY